MGLFRAATGEDVRACRDLVNEVRVLGADFVAWQHHLLQGMRGLLRAPVAIGGAFRGFTPGRPSVPLHIQRLGWADESARQAWMNYVDEVPVERTPEYKSFVGFAGGLIVRRRDQVWDPAVWRRSATFNERHRAAGIDDWVMAIGAHRPRDEFFSVWMHRGVGDPAFSEREIEMLTHVQERVVTMLGDELALASEPRLAALSRRQREVLETMLHGLSEKQIAAELRVSTPTVHEHITAIYRHYGVTSRAELMSVFVGRSRPRMKDPALGPGAPSRADPSL